MQNNEEISKRIELLNKKKESIAKNIKSLNYVNIVLTKEYSDCQNEVEYLETIGDIKRYKTYLDLKQQLENVKSSNKISIDDFKQEMENLNERYSNISVELITRYVTYTKKSNCFKGQIVEIECTKQGLEREKQKIEFELKKLVYANIKETDFNNKNDHNEQESTKSTNDIGNDFEEHFITEDVVMESLETCLD